MSSPLRSPTLFPITQKSKEEALQHEGDALVSKYQIVSKREFVVWKLAHPAECILSSLLRVRPGLYYELSPPL